MQENPRKSSLFIIVAYLLGVCLHMNMSLCDF